MFILCPIGHEINTHNSCSFYSLAVGAGFVPSKAETGGFEPPILFLVYRISSAAHSTGLCHVSALGGIAICSHARFTPLLLARAGFTVRGQIGKTCKGFLPLVFETSALPFGQPTSSFTISFFATLFKLKTEQSSVVISK